MKSIFVGNLDFSVTVSSLRDLFEAYGSVDRVTVVTDRNTGQSRGFAYVGMPDSAEADRAMAALNGASVEDRAMYVVEQHLNSDGQPVVLALSATG